MNMQVHQLCYFLQLPNCHTLIYFSENDVKIYYNMNKLRNSIKNSATINKTHTTNMDFSQTVCGRPSNEVVAKHVV